MWKNGNDVLQCSEGAPRPLGGKVWVTNPLEDITSRPIATEYQGAKVRLDALGRAHDVEKVGAYLHGFVGLNQQSKVAVCEGPGREPRQDRKLAKEVVRCWKCPGSTDEGALLETGLLVWYLVEDVT